MNMNGKKYERLSVDEWILLATRNWPDASMHKAVIQILRAADSLLLLHAAAIAPFQIQTGDFGVLAALRMSGPPYELTPTAICRSELLSSGGLTKILNRLEKSHLISRRESGSDRRSRLVQLTPKGKATVEHAAAAHGKIQDEYVADLNAMEQANLAELLDRLLKSIDIISSKNALAFSLMKQ